MIALAGVKVSFFDAAILIVAPVDGLRPSRAGVSFTLNFPKPGKLVSAPLWAASAICLNTLSTMLLACAFCQVVVGCDLVGNLIGSCHEYWLLDVITSHSVARNVTAVVELTWRAGSKSPENCRLRSEFCLWSDVAALAFATRQLRKRFVGVHVLIERPHHGLAVRADAAPVADYGRTAE